MRLALKLIAVFVAAVLLITITLSYLTVRRAYEVAEQRQKDYAERFVRELHRELIREWQKGGVKALEAYIQARSRDPYVRTRWVWFDELDGTSDAAHAPRAGNKAQQILDSEDQLLHIVTRSDDGNRELNTYCRLDVDKTRQGGIEFTSSLAFVDQQATETIFKTILMIGLIALLSIGIILLASVRIVARPLEALTRKTRRIGDGDFGEPVKVSGSDELSQLADSINEMCVRLAHQQQKIAEETEQRQKTESQLRHADRLKTVGRLAAGIAHEIGTPLGVISGRAALIADGQLGEEKNRDSARTIKKEADRITGTIRQLLDFARPNRPARTELELNEICRETIQLLSTLSGETNVRIDFEPAAETMPAWGDQSQVEQVLTNLLVNAIQASPPGSSIQVKSATVRTSPPDQAGSIGQAGEFASIAIRDHGRGIERDNLKHIFEPFFTTKDIGQGTGLGLSIAYGIVQEHGGWIDVQSEPGAGSEFTLFLPAQVEGSD